MEGEGGREKRTFMVSGVEELWFGIGVVGCGGEISRGLILVPFGFVI